MNGKSAVRREDGWLTAWVGAEFVMMHGATGEYVTLTETGGRIWEHLAGMPSADALCRALADEYAVEAGTVRAEVAAFLQDAQARGLIAVAE